MPRSVAIASREVASNPLVPKDASAASSTRSRVPTQDNVRGAGSAPPCAEIFPMTLLRRAVLLLALVPLSLLAPDAEATTPPPGVIARVGAGESTNWGGYNQGILETGKSGGFHQVAAAWTVTRATQHKSGRAEHSS